MEPGVGDLRGNPFGPQLPTGYTVCAQCEETFREEDTLLNESGLCLCLDCNDEAELIQIGEDLLIDGRSVQYRVMRPWSTGKLPQGWTYIAQRGSWCLWIADTDRQALLATGQIPASQA